MAERATPAAPADRTTFFEEQARHRRRTHWFVGAAAVGVSLAGIPVSLVVTPVLYLIALTGAHLWQLVAPLPPEFWSGIAEVGRTAVRAVEQVGEIGRALSAGRPPAIDWGAWATLAAVLVGPGMALMLLLWLWVRALFRRAGTDGTLLRIDARPPSETDPEERQLVNIVHEMAIAAGVPPPPVLVLDRSEPNALAVGQEIRDARIVVTRGLLATLSREETQGVVAHLVGSVGNGDLRMAASLLSVWQTFGLLGAILAAPTDRGSRGQVWESVRSVFRRRGHTETERIAILLATEDNPSTTVFPEALGCFGLLLLPFILAAATTRYLTSLATWLCLGPLLTAAWRARRFLADATAVQLTRDPNGLAHALQRLERVPVAFDRGNASAPLFFHWPATGGTSGWPSLGRFHPPAGHRVARLEAAGATRLRWGAPTGGPGRRFHWYTPIVWVLKLLFMILWTAGIVVSLFAGGLMLVLTLAMLSFALFAIERFFANLPAIVAFVTHDLPKIAAAIGEMLAALWARR
jgi:Zn-dependent protease with chaperone function